MCLRGLIDMSHFMGSYAQKPLILGSPTVITSLNVHGPISAQKKRIMTLDSSKCACRQDTQCPIVKNREWGSFQDQIYTFLQNSIQWGFEAKTPY
jgi:hypothetical protein